MSDFITDVEQQYEVYCKIAEDYGFIDLNAKKNGFRCTTKSNEFNAGWIAFTGAVAAVRDDQQAEIDQLKAQISLQRDRNKALEVELTSSRNYGDQLKAEKAGLGKDLQSSKALSTLRARTLSSFKEKIEDLEAKLLEKVLRGEHESS